MSFTDTFKRDVENHQLQVIRDDGLNRHLRFRRPGTMCMHFDLITWPGYLCYTGDMGTYVFRRLDDMLQFFRRGPKDQPFRIDFRYWAEKVEAQDKVDGITEFSSDKFKAEVKDYFEQETGDDEDWPADRKAALWDEIETCLFADAEIYGEHGAWAALQSFRFQDGKGEFQFTDWERGCKEYTQRFLWCCHALEWGIALYDDKASTPAPVVQEAAA